MVEAMRRGGVVLRQLKGGRALVGVEAWWGGTAVVSALRMMPCRLGALQVRMWMFLMVFGVVGDVCVEVAWRRGGLGAVGGGGGVVGFPRLSKLASALLHAVVCFRWSRRLI